jgi:hypothetical protein
MASNVVDVGGSMSHAPMLRGVLGVVEVGRHHHKRKKKRHALQAGQGGTTSSDLAPGGADGDGGGGADAGGGGGADAGGDDDDGGGDDVGDVGSGAQEARGEWLPTTSKGGGPAALTLDGTEGLKTVGGYYIDANGERWVLRPVSKDAAITVLDSVLSENLWHAWLDEVPSQPNAYGVPAGSVDNPIVQASSSLAAAQAIDAWVGAHPKPATNTKVVTAHADLSWLAFLLACAALYHLGKKAGHR